MAGKSKQKKTSTKKKKSGPGALKRFFSDPRVPKVAGLILIFLSVLLLAAFVSHILYWPVDDSAAAAHGGQQDEVSNWAGSWGVRMANQFFQWGFGIMSILFVPFLGMAGIKLLAKKANVPLWKYAKYAFPAIVWGSVFIGFITDSLPFGGVFGNWLADWMVTAIGKVGLTALLVVSLLIFLVVNFNIDFNRLVPDKQKGTGDGKKKKGAAADDKEEPDDTEVKHWEKEITEENKAAVTEPATAETTATPEPTEQQEEKDEEDDLSLEVKAPEPEPEIKQPPKQEEAAAEGPSLDIEESKQEEILDEAEHDEFEAYDPTLDLSNFKFPPLELLKFYGNDQILVDKDELEKNKNQIVQTLNNYNIEISKIKATVGPTVTLYEIVPAPGVRISKIKNLEDDIALSLAALGIRIIAPIPGRGTIGIEVPNVKKEIVSMRTLIASEKYQHTDMQLPIAIGKNISNEIVLFDLAKAPHMLMAGATGQGKSVGLNAMLVSLLYKLHPAQLKFVLIDPKKVELTLFNMIEKHYLAKLPGEEEAIITDTQKVIHTLNSLCEMMDQRYDLLKDAQVRNLKEYNEKFKKRRLNPNNGHHYMPYIVLIIDEFADLMMTAGKEVESPIARLAQLARAVGIHLVVATQRPSVNIITGVIKANFPARAAFKVTSKVDSRTILDTGGADQLIGRGDMLLSLGGDLTRIQCGFVDTPEVEDICSFIGDQQGYADAYELPEVQLEDGEEIGGLSPEDRDDMFEEAARMVVQTQQGSTSMLQRRLKLGYNRAGRLMDQLEAAGVVGPNEGSKARQVLYPDLYQLERFLNGDTGEDNDH